LEVGTARLPGKTVTKRDIVENLHHENLHHMFPVKEDGHENGIAPEFLEAAAIGITCRTL